MQKPMPALIGHRGLPLKAPENTRASLLAAKEDDIQWVEIDVTMAGDGSLVIMHDTTLKLFGQPDRKLVDLTHEDLENVDAGLWFHETFKGEPLLFLDDLLNLIQELGLCLNLEIKINPDLETSRQVSAIYSALESHRMINHNLVVSSFNHEALAQLRAQSGAVQIGVLFEGFPPQLIDDVIHLHPVSIHCDQSKLTEQQARQITPHYPLYCFTVNDTTTFEKLLNWQISGVYCDRAGAQEMRDLAAQYQTIPS